MSFFGKIGKLITSPKGIGWALGGIGGLAAGAIFDQKRGQYRSNKDFINAAYRSAQQRQQIHEGDVREGTAEDLNARGLLTTGAVQPASKISAAMGGLAPSSTIGQRQQAEDSRELGLERSDLDQAHTRALNENNASYINDLVNTGVGVAKSAISLGSGLSDLGSVGNVASAAPSTDAQMSAIASQPLPGVQVTPSRIQGAYGFNDPSNFFGGIHPLNPLEAPGSSWNRKTTVNGAGGSNADFHL